MVTSKRILAETASNLLEKPHIRRRFVYPDEEVHEFIQRLRLTAEVAGEARLAGAVSRDPNDDMVIACAVKAKADYIVTRDRDLLVLDKYRTIAMTTPEHFAGVLRGA